MLKYIKKIKVKIDLCCMYLIDVMRRNKMKIKTLSTEETIREIKDHKRSICRFGDGEFSLAFGDEIKFQDASEEMAKRMRGLLKEAKESKALVAIPHVYSTYEDYTRDSVRFWVQYHYKNRRKIYECLDSKYTYGDAQITRIYLNRKNKEDSVKYFDMWKQVWNNQDVLLVEGELSRFGTGNDLFDECKSVRRILCPSKNAFVVYDRILDEVKKYGQGCLILLVLGPTATLLADDLASAGFWAIDLGNLDMEYEWSRISARTQTKIAGKYSHEAIGGDEVEDLNDKKYQSQIIARIMENEEL